MRKEYHSYRSFIPAHPYENTHIPIKPAPKSWEWTVLEYGKRLGLLPEFIANIHALHDSGLGNIVVEQAIQANNEKRALFSADLHGHQKVEEYNQYAGKICLQLSERAASIALDSFSGKKSALIWTSNNAAQDLSDVSEVLPHDAFVKKTIIEKKILNADKVVQAYRTLFSMSQLMFLFFTGEANLARENFHINPKIFLSTLTYICSMASSGLSDEMKKVKTTPTMATYLLADNGKALADVFFTADLAENDLNVEDIHLMTHFLTIHSRLVGIIGDTLLLTKLDKHIEPIVPFAFHAYGKDELFTALVYPEAKYDWFNVIKPPNLISLLALLGLEGAPRFAEQLQIATNQGKTAMHGAWKNSLRMIGDSVHDGVNFTPYIEELRRLLREKKLIPPRGYSIHIRDILNQLVKLKLDDMEGIKTALDPKTYNVPDAYKFRFFIEDENLNGLIELLKDDVVKHPHLHKEQPFLLLVDPIDNRKVEKINILDVVNAKCIISDQFKKGGRGMIFLRLSLPQLIENVEYTASGEPKALEKNIEIQFTLMSKAHDFYRQRIQYGETRLMGKPVDRQE